MKQIIKSFAAIAAAILAIASCMRETDQQPVVPAGEFHTVSITVGEPEGKTTVANVEGRAVYSWEADDYKRINVFEDGVKATSVAGTLTDGILTITATFEGAADGNDHTYTANFNGQVTDQKASATAYDATSDVMVAYPVVSKSATSFKFNFKRVSTIHKITFKGLQACAGKGVEKINISCKSGIAGTYTPATNPADEGTWSDMETVKVLTDEKIATDGSFKVMVVTRPLAEATLSFSIVTEDGHLYGKTTPANAVTVAAGNVTSYAVSCVEIVPALTISGIDPVVTDVYGINNESPDAISKNITIRSNAAWTIKKGADSDWLTISATSGGANEDCIVSLTADENTTDAKRQATFTVEAKFDNGTTLIKYFSVTQNVPGTLLAYWVFNENEAKTAYPYLYETIDSEGKTGKITNPTTGKITVDKTDNIIRAKGATNETWVRFRNQTYLRPSKTTPVGAPVMSYQGNSSIISIEIPGITLTKDDVVRLDFYVCPGPKSPKYWVVDGRCSGSTFYYWPDLMAVPGSTKYKYNLELAGGAQHIVIDQTIKTSVTTSASSPLFFRLNTQATSAGGNDLFKYCVDGTTVNAPADEHFYFLGSSDAEGHFPYNMTITKL